GRDSARHVPHRETQGQQVRTIRPARQEREGRLVRRELPRQEPVRHQARRKHPVRRDRRRDSARQKRQERLVRRDLHRAEHAGKDGDRVSVPPESVKEEVRVRTEMLRAREEETTATAETDAMEETAETAATAEDARREA